MTSTRVWRRMRNPRVIATVCAAVLCLSIGFVGCVQVGGGAAGNGAEGAQVLGASILNIQTDMVLSRGVSITVVYTTPASATNIRAFYVPVTGSGTTAVEVGTEQVFATSLSAGDTQTVPFNTDVAGVGTFKIGIRFSLGSQEGRAISNGVITITDLPVPVFELPNQDLTVLRGAIVQVRAVLGVPENAVQWRLFLIAAGASTSGIPADQLGTGLSTGGQNVIEYSWNTASVTPGAYQVGASSTNTGSSIADTVAAGDEEQIVTVLNEFIITVLSESQAGELAPTIDVTEPASAVEAFGDTSVPVAFEGQVQQGLPEAQKIDVFYDTNTSYDQDGTEVVFAPNLPVESTNSSLNTAPLEEDVVYHVGAAIFDGVSPPVAGYAPGSVKVTRTPMLDVTAPDTQQNYRPGEEVSIRWTTNVPEDLGDVDVFMRRVVDGVETGAEIQILPPSPLSTTEATLTTGDSGRFRINVRITSDDPLVGTLVASAPALVIVSTLPTILWVGDLADPDTAPFDGLILEGHNFEDNFGSLFLGGEDYNGDGYPDFLAAACYGKPEFIGPSGIGEGEVDLIRGRGQRYSGSVNVNLTSSEALPGLVFSGIPGAIDSTTGLPQTYGLVSLFRCNDVDEDGLGELMFGFPWVNNTPMGVIAGQLPRSSAFDAYGGGQFLGGGVVVVSSTNSALNSSSGDTNGKRITLEWVGQFFESTAVAPEPGEGDLCSGDSSWRADLLEPEDGECGSADTAAGLEGCRPNDSDGGDGDWDSFIQPRFGFNYALAINFVQHYIGRTGFFPCTNVVFESVCPTCRYDNGFLEPYLAFLDFAPSDPCAACAQFTGGFEPRVVNDMSNPDCSLLTLPTIPAEGEAPFDCEDAKADYLSGMRYGGPLFDMNLVPTGANPNPRVRSGFYVDRISGIEGDDSSDINWNEPREPFGCRILGRPAEDPTVPTSIHRTQGLFGSSIAQSGDELIISAPNRTATSLSAGFTPTGALVGPWWPSTVNPLEAFWQDAFGIPDKSLPPGYEPATQPTNLDSGVAYMISNIDLWTLDLRDWIAEDNTGDFGRPDDYRDFADGRMPPKPHMYMAGGQSHTAWHSDGARAPGSGFSRTETLFFGNVSRDGGLGIAGGVGDNIRNIVGIPDFNGDGRDDFAIGAPQADVLGSGEDDGAVYVPFRRSRSLEGDYVLEKLAYATNNPGRLAGILITGDEGQGEGFGDSLVSGMDFNHDGVADLVIGNPRADGGRGEVWIVFATLTLTTPENGIPIQTLLEEGRAARIFGTDPGTLFGFTVANGGDINGDGYDDLLVAAPSATPSFDSNPFDDNDVLDTLGLDRDMDGKKDDVTGPLGFPDGKVDGLDSLTRAGLVYVIYGGIDATKFGAADGDGSLQEISIGELGEATLPGFIVVGRRAGDQLGGGFAGELQDGDPFFGYADGGIPEKRQPGDFGRSYGVNGVGDIDGDGRDDFMVGSILADPRIDPKSGVGTVNAGEGYLLYGFER